MFWVIGCIANGAVALAYLLIVAAIVVPLIRSQQVRSNLLGMATAAIFFTCAVHHGGHVVHMLLPYADLDRQGLDLRQSYDWEMAFWDIVTALVGVYYWTLRRNLAADVRGATLFDDLRRREQDALALNDDVLQGLVVAKLAIELGQTERAMSALDASISAASGMVSNLLGSSASHGLRRAAAASLQAKS